MPLRTGTLLLALSTAAVSVVRGQAAVPSPADQVAAAVLPLPQSLQAGAGVRGYTADLALVVLRPGTNSMMCTADRPGDERFDVRCYDRSFLAVMDWRRELVRAGLDSASLEQRFLEGIQSDTHRLPDHPTAGYRMLGPIAAYDPGTHTAGPAIRKWQSIHFPYRTAAELGLPTDEENAMPFVMASGTWWAHVMITHWPPE
jgi:hypothetical protein